MVDWLVVRMMVLNLAFISWRGGVLEAKFNTIIVTEHLLPL
jgi:hypothetical protein